MAAVVAMGAGVLILSGCGGETDETDLSGVDPLFRDQIENPTGCEDLQSIANAMNARVEAFEYGTPDYDNAYATFMAAGDVLTEMGCPGW